MCSDHKHQENSAGRLGRYNPMIKENDKYNPFNDRSLHTSLKEEMIPTEDREGFNDALKHYDGVNGFQSIKSISGLPKPYKNIIKIFAFIAVGGLLITLIFTLIGNFKAIF
jgi:hypothetical protein